MDCCSANRRKQASRLTAIPRHSSQLVVLHGPCQPASATVESPTTAALLLNRPYAAHATKIYQVKKGPRENTYKRHLLPQLPRGEKGASRHSSRRQKGRASWEQAEESVGRRAVELTHMQRGEGPTNSWVGVWWKGNKTGSRPATRPKRMNISGEDLPSQPGLPPNCLAAAENPSTCRYDSKSGWLGQKTLEVSTGWSTDNERTWGRKIMSNLLCCPDTQPARLPRRADDWIGSVRHCCGYRHCKKTAKGGRRRQEAGEKRWRPVQIP